MLHTVQSIHGLAASIYFSAHILPYISISIDLLPNYGPGTSERYRKPVTTGNTVISNWEKRNFRYSSDLAQAKVYLFAILVIFDMPSTCHFFWSFCSQVDVTMVLVGFYGVFVFGSRTLRAVVSRFWQSFRRLRPLKSGLDILTKLRKYWEIFQFEIESLWKEKVKSMPSSDQFSRSVDKGQASRHFCIRHGCEVSFFYEMPITKST